MIFVIGGRAQGKTVFAAGLLKGVRTATADGRLSEYHEAMNAGLVTHLECFVRRLMQDGEDPHEFVRELLESNGNAVVTADEIGYGIVPADPFERDYRETAGRACQEIAAFSVEVHRVICGLGTRIK